MIWKLYDVELFITNTAQVVTNLLATDQYHCHANLWTLNTIVDKKLYVGNLKKNQ